MQKAEKESQNNQGAENMDFGLQMFKPMKKYETVNVKN